MKTYRQTLTALDSEFRQATTTPSSGEILWVSWFGRLSPGNHYRNLVASARRYCRPFATAYPFDTPVNHDSQSPADSLVDSAQDHLTDCDQLSQSLDTSRTDSSDNSLDILLSELPIETEPVQLMNQLLTQLTTNPSTEIHPTPFTGLLPILS